jgi:hypothetical protein
MTPPRLVVLELFTSQSCSSCPPADALLAELGRTRPDVLPLDFHVDYWNQLGWRDKYASVAASDRQRVYAEALGTQMYTPELVVDGRHPVIGSDRDAVQTAIEAAQQDVAHTPEIGLTARREDGHIAIDVGEGAGQGRLLLAGFDPVHTTQVGGGENDGRTLTEINVVREFQDVGAWQGARLHVVADMPAGEQAAVLLQDPTGHVIAAARLEP